MPSRAGTKSMRSTSYDVAREAGVSQSTVSRAFDPKAPIADDVRAKVRETAKRLGWQPNSIARSLQSRNTNVVGLITEDLVSPWRSLQLSALVPALQLAGVRPLVFEASDSDDIDQIVGEVASYQGRAVVIGAGAISSDLAKIFADQGVLVVIINRWIAAPGVLSLVCDNRDGGRQVAEHFAERGCRRIVIVHRSQSQSGSDRVAGLVERGAELGIETEIVEVPDQSRESGSRVGAMLAPRLGSFDGVFCINDALALGIVDQAYRSGAYRVGRDFALVGFDGVLEAESPACDLTTMRQPLTEIVGSVSHWLGDWKKDGRAVQPADSRRFKPELIVRGSSASFVPKPAGAP